MMESVRRKVVQPAYEVTRNTLTTQTTERKTVLRRRKERGERDLEKGGNTNERKD